MTIPVLDLSRLPPGRMTMPYVTPGGIEGGKSLSGVSTVVDMTGGGLVAVKYADIGLGNLDGSNLRYWSRLSAILTGGVRSIIVPLLTDFMVQTYTVGGGLSEAAVVSFSDGALFSDGSSFSQLIINAICAVDAPLNAGTIVINMIAGFSLEGGEWFSIEHPTRLSRAYCITDVDGVVSQNANVGTFTVGIRPPLREAVPAGSKINFVRPRCLMRVDAAAAITNDVDGWWWSTPEIAFIESFGTT